MSDSTFAVILVGIAAAGAFMFARSESARRERQLEQDLEAMRRIAAAGQCGPNDLGCHIGKTIQGAWGIVDVFV